MKKFLLFFLLILSIKSLIAQNYRTIDAKRERHFTCNKKNHVPITGNHNKHTHSIRIDSTSNIGCDSIFYNYRIIDHMYKAGEQCIDIKDTNWLGIKTIIFTNGYNTYFNKNADSINFNTQAAIGNKWNLFYLSHGGYLEAKVIDISVDQVLGKKDNVKTIVIQAKNKLGESIPHRFNGKKIKISENFGFVQIYNLFDFPEDTSLYILTGRSRYNLLAKDIYDFDIGDEFHFEGGYQGAGLIYHTYTLKQVVGKFISSNKDTIRYMIEEKNYNKYGKPPSDYTINYSYVTHESLVILSDIAYLNNLSYETFVSKMSHGSVKEAGYTFQLTDKTLNGRVQKGVVPYLGYDTTNNCMKETIGKCMNRIDTYAKGLGQIASINKYDPQCNQWKLIYYKKKNDIWGIPVNWSELVGIEKRVTPRIKVYPNPVSDFIKIGFENSSANDKEIFLHNTFGEILYKTRIQGSIDFAEVNVMALPKGFYILSINDGEHRYTTKLTK